MTGAAQEDDRPFEFTFPGPIHRVEDLLRGHNEARILLGETAYTLRLTRARKLILTK